VQHPSQTQNPARKISFIRDRGRADAGVRRKPTGGRGTWGPNIDGFFTLICRKGCVTKGGKGGDTSQGRRVNRMKKLPSDIKCLPCGKETCGLKEEKKDIHRGGKKKRGRFWGEGGRDRRGNPRPGSPSFGESTQPCRGEGDDGEKPWGNGGVVSEFGGGHTSRRAAQWGKKNEKER